MIKVCGCTLPYEHCCGRNRTYQPQAEWLTRPVHITRDREDLRRLLQEMVRHVPRGMAPLLPMDLDGLHSQ